MLDLDDEEIKATRIRNGVEKNEDKIENKIEETSDNHIAKFI